MTLTGLDRLQAEPELLASFIAGDTVLHAKAGPKAGPKAGLLANPCSVTSRFERSVEIVQRAMAFAGGELVALFGPEHGFYGEAQAGIKVGDSRDRMTSLPVHSLYGEARKIDPDTLASLDLLVVDLQDVGARPYTYLSTLDLLVGALGELEASTGKPPLLVILDRPNPLGGMVLEGMGVASGFESFVGARNIPFRHGLTTGEFALFSARGRTAAVRVLPLAGWERHFLWPDTGLPWIAPSPNLPSFDSALCYPATVLLEATNVSEGRGTTKPFEVFGAPWINGEELARLVDGLRLPGLAARPLFFVPAFSKYQGERCSGIQIHVTDRRVFRPVYAGYAILELLRDRWAARFEILPPSENGSRYPLDLLSGNGLASSGAGIAAIRAKALETETEFHEARASFLLYPETTQ
ncbi:MAG: DUF1343 domain-containing protein [Rectinemataceae bacterium]